MGKKRVIKKSGEQEVRMEGETVRSKKVRAKKQVTHAIAHILATYNNTLITITDERGGVLAASSSGAIGFSGAKKATPFAAAKVAEKVLEKAKKIQFQDISIRVSGVGSGRDAAVRAFANHGLNILSIKDTTPIPHNGPRPKKVRRV